MEYKKIRVKWCPKMKCKFEKKCTLKTLLNAQTIFKNDLELFSHKYNKFGVFK